MKKFFIALVVFGFIFSSCSFIKEIKPKPFVEPKLKVVVTNQVLYDFAVKIGGKHVDVFNLNLVIPADVDPETFFPVGENLEKIEAADVFIYMGDLADPWAENILNSSNKNGLTVIDASIDAEVDDAENNQIMVENIASGLIVADPKNKDDYQKVAGELEVELGAAK